MTNKTQTLSKIQRLSRNICLPSMICFITGLIISNSIWEFLLYTSFIDFIILVINFNNAMVKDDMKNMKYISAFLNALLVAVIAVITVSVIMAK